MPDATWRCSQCGTVNEPVANACRTCGRWPSLFDLEESQLEEIPPLQTAAPAPTPALDRDQQPEVLPADDLSPEVEEPEPYDVEEPSAAPPWRRLLRFAVPVGIALYILVSSALNR